MIWWAQRYNVLFSNFFQFASSIDISAQKQEYGHGQGYMSALSLISNPLESLI